jgi:D-alanine-D-alanine ligase
MRIGIAFDLRDDSAAPAGAPDDWQEEFDAPVTIRAIADALRAAGHQPVELGDGPDLVRRLLDNPPDLVFNLAEGHGVGRSREARVPAVCELLGIPCTGSDPLALAVALDKDAARKLVAAEHEPGGVRVRVPRGYLFEPRHAAGTAKLAARSVPFPVIVKPNWEGSSKGIRRRCLVHTPEELPAVVAELRRDYAQPLLIEEFIAGDEVTVGVLQDKGWARIFGVMRVRPVEPTPHFVYSLEVKRDFRRQVAYDLPTDYAPTTLDLLQHAALTAFHALGCRDVARIDFRLRDGVPYFLEANPLPGLNPESSDLVIMAGLVGVSHARLVQSILAAALERLGMGGGGSPSAHR